MTRYNYHKCPYCNGTICIKMELKASIKEKRKGILVGKLRKERKKRLTS